MKKYNIYIIMMLVDMYDRTDVEKLQGEQFECWGDFYGYIENLNPIADFVSVQIYTLAEYMNFCNDEMLVHVDNWVTYIQIGEPEEIET